MFSTCADTSVNYAKNGLKDSVQVPVIKVFSSVLKLGKKLECLYLVGFYNIVYCLG